MNPPNDQRPLAEDVDVEEEHCTICLQSFLDKTIIPVCAHEFCFECILLWSEQSRKCPLCSRSFEDTHLIHHVRSQYDYQKHYLPPMRTSPDPPLTATSRVTALRNTRRERQWGRRQRQQREEADQLDRAIARRRWIYQHHLYAKHVASNAYTRYRPFPTPTQFAASPDLISRMTTFLRRELHVWPNLDVEFLTTYTISLMKSIDIRSESAVKLLSEFLDLDCPYAPGARQVNAEHFAHEIYSYLRSPYRDLNMYDQMAQYDIPLEISPPREIERGSRWHSPCRRSRSRSWSPHHESHERYRDRVSVDGPSRRQSISPGEEGGDRHGAQDMLRNGPIGLEGSSSETGVETLGAVQQHPQDNQKGKHSADVTENCNKDGCDPATTATPNKGSLLCRGDDVATVVAMDETNVTGLMEGPLEGRRSDAVINYVDKVLDGGSSSANSLASRKRMAGMDVHRHRTLSASVQAYLSLPVLRYRRDEKASGTDTSPRLLRHLTDGRTDAESSAKDGTLHNDK